MQGKWWWSALLVAAAACSGFTASEPGGAATGSGGTAGVQASVTVGDGGGPGASSSSGTGSSATASSSTASSSSNVSSSASSSTASSSSASSSTAASSGAGGAPPECDGKPKGTQCFSNCGCPMPNCYVPKDNLTCTAGLCDGKGACQKFLPVTCKVGNTNYTACTGFASNASIFYNGGAGKCQTANDAGYCAPGVDCFVSVGGVLKGTGVCQ